MTIVDGHVHLWSHDMTRFPTKEWQINGPSRLPAEDGTAEGLVERMDAAGVSYALNVQVPWYEEDNRYHHDAVARFPGRFAFLAVLDLDTPGAAGRLEQMVAEQGAQGFRIHLIEPGRADEVIYGKHDGLLETARRLEVTVQFLARVDHTPAIVHTTRRFEGVRVVIDHLLHPNPERGPDYAEWREFFDLGAYERAYVKVSCQVNHSRAAYPHADLHGFTQRVLERYTPQRCLWGSNYPLIPADVPYDRILAIVRDELPGLAGDDLEWVLGRTAMSLWQPRE